MVLVDGAGIQDDEDVTFVVVSACLPLQQYT